ADADFAPQPGANHPDGCEYPGLYPLLNAPFLGQLRFFRLGEAVNFDSDSHNCRTTGEAVDQLVASMARIEELHILAHEVDDPDLFSLANLGNLRTLVRYHGHDVIALRNLANNPHLRSLETIRAHPSHSPDSSSL